MTHSLRASARGGTVTVGHVFALDHATHGLVGWMVASPKARYVAVRSVLTGGGLWRMAVGKRDWSVISSEIRALRGQMGKPSVALARMLTAGRALGAKTHVRYWYSRQSTASEPAKVELALEGWLYRQFLGPELGKAGGRHQAAPRSFSSRPAGSGARA